MAREENHYTEDSGSTELKPFQFLRRLQMQKLKQFNKKVKVKENLV